MLEAVAVMFWPQSCYPEALFVIWCYTHLFKDFSCGLGGRMAEGRRIKAVAV